LRATLIESGAPVASRVVGIELFLALKSPEIRSLHWARHSCQDRDMRILTKILLFALFASFTSSGKPAPKSRDIPNGNIVQSAIHPRRFYKVDQENLLQIPDEKTMQALVVKTNCGKVKPLPILKLTENEENSYTTGAIHERLEVRQDKTIPSNAPFGTKRAIIIPNGFVYYDACVYPWRIAAQHGGFEAHVRVDPPDSEQRTYVWFTTVRGGGVCNVFIRPSG